MNRNTKASDKVERKAEDLKGRAKEAAGAATDDDELRAEGRTDQVAAGAKEKIDAARGKAEDLVDKARDRVRSVLRRD